MVYGAIDVLIAFSLTLVSGLATGIGGLFVLRAKQTNFKFISAALGFSAGVMIYVSFVELFPDALDRLSEAHGETGGAWLTTISFFIGIALIAIIDKLVPSGENPHEMSSKQEITAIQENIKDADLIVTDQTESSEAVIESEAMSVRTRDALMRTGLFSALAIAIHNFPEGLATFMSALQDPALGVTIALAIAIHNVPEGISVAVPVYYATGSKRKALGYAFLSGMAEPLGALVGFIILMPFITPALLGYIFAAVAGIMVYISLDELLPTAEKYGEHHVAIWGLIAGMGVMALSMLLLM